MQVAVPNPCEQSVGWALAFLDDWRECRDDADLASGKAWALLAAHGSVLRFFTAGNLPGDAAEVQPALEQDAPALLAALRRYPKVTDWIERARHLERAWDFAHDRTTQMELQMATCTLFDELDRHELAVCQARRLAGASGIDAAWLEDRQQPIEEAENYFADHVDLFLPAAPQAIATLAACRADLDEDEDLWNTILKHGLLEEAAEDWADDRSASLLSEWGRRDLAAAAVRSRARGTAVVEPWRQDDKPKHSWWREPASIAAKNGPSAQPLEFRDWCSPDGRFKGQLAVNPLDAGPLRVNFFDLTVGKAVAPGSEARLADVPGAINEDGNADFSRQGVQRASETGIGLTLTVDGVLWQPMSEGDSR